MKKLPKILIIFFLSVFILQMVCLIFLLATPKKSQAADATFIPQVSIDSTFQKGIATAPSIAKYIKAIYNYAIGIVGILAAVVLMFGGVIWLTAGGSQEKVKEAKAWIGASLSGLVLILCSYMILNTINPDLVSFKEIVPSPIEYESKENCEWALYTPEVKARYTDEQICANVNKKLAEGYCYEKKPTDSVCCCTTIPAPNIIIGEPIPCNNNDIAEGDIEQGGESCDGTDLRGYTCQTLSQAMIDQQVEGAPIYTDGVLRCLGCGFDPTGCTPQNN